VLSFCINHRAGLSQGRSNADVQKNPELSVPHPPSAQSCKHKQQPGDRSGRG
jgi:hypothetical protein